MLRPRLGYSSLRDFLYYLFNRGESLESDHTGEPYAEASTYSIGIIAATQREADLVLARISRIMNDYLAIPNRHRFFAYGLDQAWRPQQLFAEAHWIHNYPDKPLPQERLADLGSVVHIHLLNTDNIRRQPRLRCYLWRSVGDLAEILASLYLSKERCDRLPLNRRSYCRWQLEARCMITVDYSWGSTSQAAIENMVQKVAPIPSRSSFPILIIEACSDANIGDFTGIVGALEHSFGCDFITSFWLSQNYSGFGLKLVNYLNP